MHTVPFVPLWPSLANRTDIRSFFASPPVTKKNAKPNSPKAGGRRVSLGVDTPATAAATPSPAVDPAKKEIQTPSPSPIASGTTAAKSPASIASCSPEVIAVVAERVCTLGSGRESRVLPRREVISLAESPRNGNKREVGKIDTEGSVSGVVLRRRAAHLAASAAAAAGPSGGSSSGEDNKENKVIKRVKSSSVDTKARLARPVLRAPEMSGYFLQGPISAKRDSEGHSGGSRSGSQGTVDVAGTQTRPSSMYALPVGEVVVGRDSVRDSNPTNKNKLRMGVDKQEEVGCCFRVLACVISCPRASIWSGGGWLRFSCFFNLSGRYGVKRTEVMGRTLQDGVVRVSLCFTSHASVGFASTSHHRCRKRGNQSGGTMCFEAHVMFGSLRQSRHARVVDVPPIG